MELEGQLLGDYRILREIGRGGMGIVYLAEQVSLGRRVALKVLPHRSALSPEAMTRFRREAEAASRLDHPHICAVYATGEHEGIPFIAMRYIEGLTLSRRLQERRLSPSEDGDEDSDSTFSLDFSGEEPGEGGGPGEVPSDTTTSSSGTREDIRRNLVMLEKVARALQAAHESGVVHRDIKPGNIMITPEGEPVVLDFGLARNLEGTEGPSLTHTGDLMGTPHYMSPEQISGAEQIDARTDVYSLGVTLYELLTLKRPFDSPNREGLYRAILTGDPEPARQANPLIERDVEIVLECALERDLDRRYQSAAAFADDLQAILNHEEIAARPVGPWLRLRKWARRNPLVAATVAFAFILLLAGYIETSFSRRKIERTLQQRSAALQAKNEALEAEKAAVAAREKALEQARAQRKRAEDALQAEQKAQEEREEALVRARALRLAAEVYARREDDPDLALRLAIEAARVRRRPETDQALRYALRGNPAIGRFGFLAGRDVEDGRARDASGRRSTDNSVPRTRLPAVGDVHWKSGTIATLNPLADEPPLVWQLNGSGRVQVLGGHQADVRAVRFSPDGKLCVTGSDDGEARIFDLASGETLHVLGDSAEPRESYRHEGGVHYVEFSHDGSLVVTITDDDVIRFWRTASGKPMARIPDTRYRVLEGPRIARFSPREDLFAIIKRDVAEIVAISGPNKRRWLRCEGASGRPAIWALEWSPDGRYLATGDHSGTVTVFEVPAERWAGGRNPSARIVATLSGTHDDHVRCLAFSADGRRLASGGSDRRAVVWDLQTQHAIATFEDHRGPVLDVALSRTGDRIVTGCSDSRASLYDVEQVRLISRLAGHRDWVSRVAFSPDDARVATLALDGTGLLFSTRAASADLEVAHLGDGIESLQLSENGRRILAASRQGEIRVIDLGEDGAARALLAEDLRGLRAASFSDPDGEGLFLLEGGARWLSHRAPSHPESQWELTLTSGGARGVTSLEAESLIGIHHSAKRMIAIHPGSYPVIVDLDEQKAAESREVQLRELYSRRHVVAVRPGTGEFLVWPRALRPVLVDPRTPESPRELPPIEGWPRDATFSPDGSQVALTNLKGEVHLVSLGEPPSVRRLGLWSCPPVWSTEGLGLICGPPDGGIAIIDPAAGSIRTTDLGKRVGPVKRLGLSPDGLTLVSHSGADLWLWDLQNARQLSMIRGVPSEITSWVFEPDGNFLIVGHANGAVRRVPLDPLVHARRLSPRPLTSDEMSQFEVGSEEERREQLRRELEIAREIEIVGLLRRLSVRRTRENLIRYAERILRRDDPVPELFQEALSCAMTASDMQRKADPHILEVLSRAYYRNGEQVQAVATAERGLAIAPPGSPVSERLAGNLSSFRDTEQTEGP